MLDKLIYSTRFDALKEKISSIKTVTTIKNELINEYYKF